MALEQTQRLSRKLLASCLVEDGGVFLCDRDYLAHTILLPERLREEVNELMQQIRSVVPTDFTFTVSFEVAGATLRTIFEDGNTEADAFMGCFTTSKSIMRRLRRLPWDDIRAELINRGGVFDELVSDASDRPVNIPSSETAAKRYANELIAEVRNVQQSNPVPAFSLIIARDDLGVNTEALASRQELFGTIADRMTTQNDILAVLENGVPWSFQEIEEAKLEAVEGLGPISRAKAEGRMVF